jgi:tetratricopeptide (TPR) repeat protein
MPTVPHRYVTPLARPLDQGGLFARAEVQALQSAHDKSTEDALAFVDLIDQEESRSNSTIERSHRIPRLGSVQERIERRLPPIQLCLTIPDAVPTGHLAPLTLPSPLAKARRQGGRRPGEGCDETVRISRIGIVGQSPPIPSSHAQRSNNICWESSRPAFAAAATVACLAVVSWLTVGPESLAASVFEASAESAANVARLTGGSETTARTYVKPDTGECCAADGEKPQQPLQPVDQKPALPEADLPHGHDPTYIPQKAAPADKLAQFEAEIKALLDTGWGAKQQAALDSAHFHFRAAQTLAPNDPRAPFAFGIVLLKNNKYDEALRQFDTAGESSDPAYLPAYRAAIWLRILRGGRYYEPGTLGLVKFTRTWRQAEPNPLPNWVQTDLVHWTGRLAGFLDGPVQSRSMDALIEKCVAEIATALSNEQRELFQSARNDVLDEYAEKATVQERTRLDAKKQQEQAAKDLKARLAQEATEAKQQKKQIEKKAEDVERAINEQLAAIDHQIAVLLRDQDRFEAQLQRVASLMQFMDHEIEALLIERQQILADQADRLPSQDGTKSGTTKPNHIVDGRLLTIGTLIDARTRERLRYQADYDRIDRQLRETQRQGAVIMNRRQTLVAEYQAITGKLYKDSESLVAREKFIERRKNEASKPVTGSTAQVKALGQTARALRTYVDMNVELEKQRILDSFKAL